MVCGGVWFVVVTNYKNIKKQFSFWSKWISVAFLIGLLLVLIFFMAIEARIKGVILEPVRAGQAQMRSAPVAVMPILTRSGSATLRS